MIALTFLLALIALFVAVVAQRESGRAQEAMDQLREALTVALRRLADLERGSSSPAAPPATAEPAVEEPEPDFSEATLAEAEPSGGLLTRLQRASEAAVSAAGQPVAPPLLPPLLGQKPEAMPVPPPLPRFAAQAEAEPAPAETPLAPPVSAGPQFNWEQFLGVKGLAWIAGFALFLGVVFFLKYSFDKGWVTPVMRTVMGFLTGTGLLIGGAWLQRKKLSIPAQALCASGVVILYATTFAARSLFGLIPTGVAFGVMSVVTVAAFALAVRFNARVIAILGLFGGFLTPILVSTGEDNPLGLFTYIALLDAGLLAVALRQRWNFLAALGAAGTVLMQLAWLARFFEPGLYFEGGRILIPFAVFLGFSGLFLAALAQAKRLELDDEWFFVPAIALPVVALGVTLYFLGFPALAHRPAVLFPYVLLAGACLFAMPWITRRGSPVPALGGALIVLVQLAWVARAFQPGGFFEGSKVLLPMGVFLGFSLVFLGALVLARRRGLDDQWFLAPAFAQPVVALAVTFYFLSFPALAERPALLFTYVLLADACLLALAWLHRHAEIAPALGGALAFALLAVWTGGSATLTLLNTGLVLYLLFGAVHAVQPLVFQRFRPEARVPWWSNAWALVALALMLLPILKLTPAGPALWLFVLLVDLLVIALAVVSGFVLWVVAALVLTLVSAGAWIFSAPPGVERLTGDLLVIGLFAGVFIAAGVYLSRRLAARTPTGLPFPTKPDDLWSNEILLPRVPALAAVMPFALLGLITLRLPLVNPSPVFGLGLLLIVLLLGLARYFRLSVMPGIGLLSVLALEHAWYFARFTEPMAMTALTWFAGFTLLFTVYPFLFWRELKEEVVPWAAAALAGPLHFYLVHHLVKHVWPNPYMGLLPALFALPALAGLFFLVKHLSTEDGRRNTQLALFGGAALFFITLIFPLQFSKQWLTLSWALEGVALLWLFHRVPHPGLRLTALALLATSFIRLVNPFVLGYHARSDTPIFNWYLYTYGVTVICCFAAARLLAPPRERVFGVNVPPMLHTLGAILAFVLVNLEIADYYTPAGATRLVFEFSGDFARDMTYTIAWAVFALLLVGIGLARRLGPCRWAGLSLLLVTLTKLFLHDLARLDALYRVGAFIAVAVIAFAASFLYQRFFARTKPDANP
jgi:uncharacterized membrane protein